MPIEQIQLKNGQKYPVSPAYREPVVPGNAMDYPFAYDAEAQGQGSLTITVTVGGSTVQEDSFPLMPLTEHEFTSAELAAMSAAGNSSLGRFYIGDAMVADTNVLIGLFLAMNGVVPSGSFEDLPGAVAAMSIANYVFGVASFDAAASVSEAISGTAGGYPAEITAAVIVPAAGSYYVPLCSPSIREGLGGTVSVCSFELDARFYGHGIDVVNNYLLAAQLQGGASVDLTAFPAVEAKLLHNARSGRPIALVFGMDYRVPISGESSGDSYGWHFADGGTMTYSSLAHTLTYTAGS